MQLKTSFLTTNKATERSTYLWNMAGSMLMAFQSVIMLMILTRTVGLVGAGIFTIAYANANLFLTVGKYGMRNFQVSDIKHQFSFQEYITSRKITVAFMFLISFIYTMYTASAMHYTLEKTIIILLMCIFKMADAIEDIYTGRYQQENRLDIGAKIMTLRLAISIIIFAISLIIFQNLLYSLFIVIIVTYILLFFFVKSANSLFTKEEKHITFHNITNLLKICFPLFISNFLSFYIGNAPKYAIDSVLNDELQACYGFISMPVFVIGLLNGFIFNPVIYKMSHLWDNQQTYRFIKRCFVQIGIIFMLTLVCLMGAYLLGIPVLSLLYNTDLSAFKTELLLLMLGGGLLGLTGLLTTIITIIRYQKSLTFVYGIVALMALFLSDFIVQQAQIMGAAILYTILMGILCILLGIIVIIGIYKKSASKNKR